MKQRTLVISVEVNADIYEGKTDEQILELLFLHNELPGGATVQVIRGTMPLIMCLLEHVMEEKRPGTGTSIFNTLEP